MKVTDRTRIKNHPERAVPDEAADILAAGMVAHVGFVEDGQPFVIPFSYLYDPAKPDRLYLHSSVTSRAMNLLAGGTPVCVTVTLVDGLVFSRKALSHSINYRSVVLLGKACAVTDQSEKFELLEQMVRRYFPGRVIDQDYNAPPPGDIDVTAMVEVQIEEWNAKARRGGPLGPDDDRSDLPGSAGVVELREV